MNTMFMMITLFTKLNIGDVALHSTYTIFFIHALTYLVSICLDGQLTEILYL
jgi:hypothetical protein